MMMAVLGLGEYSVQCDACDCWLCLTCMGGVAAAKSVQSAQSGKFYCPATACEYWQSAQGKAIVKAANAAGNGAKKQQKAAASKI